MRPLFLWLVTLPIGQILTLVGADLQPIDITSGLCEGFGLQHPTPDELAARVLVEEFQALPEALRVVIASSRRDFSH